MRKLDLTKEALEFWEALDAKRYKQIGRKITALLENATPPDSSDLKGYDLKRVDIGEYRIVYHFDANTVYIDAVGKRNDDEVYKMLKKR